MTTAQRRTLLAAILASSIVFIDGTIVTIALQRIGQELPTRALGVLEAQTYVVSGYMATLAALLILGGALGDRYGRRRIFLIGLTGFGLASAACGLAPTMEALVAARLLQGVAGALLVPGSLAVIAATFDARDRGRAYGIWAASTSAVNLLGPAAGGFLVSISWRAAFLLNLPIVAVALWLAIRWMRESRDEDAPRGFDFLGAAVAIIAVGGVMFGAVRGQERAWRDPVAIAVLVAGALAAVAFPFLMRRRGALVPLALFRSRRFAAINLSTFTIYAGLYSLIFFQSLFLQGILGYTPLGAALVFTAMGLCLTILSARVGAAAGRLGPRRFLTAGPLVAAAGVLWWLTVSADSPAWRLDAGDPATYLPPIQTLFGPVVAIAVMASGMALIVAPLTTALMAGVPVGRAGVASAVNNAISRVGQPLLFPLVFILASATFYATLAARVPGLDTGSAAVRDAIQPLNPPPAALDPAVASAVRFASTDAFHLVAVVIAGLFAIGSIVNWLGLRETHGHGDLAAAERAADEDRVADAAHEAASS
jgi:EmrB/QacA subfamily drug resistance transporter